MAVYKKNSTWWIDFYYQGKRYRQKIGTKKKDAEDALNHIKVKIAAGDYVPMEERQREQELAPQAILFKKFATEEFLPWSETTHSTRHYGNLELILRKHLIPHFAGKHVHSITRKHIEDYITKRSRSTFTRGRKKRPIKNTSVNRDIACIKLLFKKSRRMGQP